MSYEMKLLRKEDISLYLYIKDIVLRDFIETEEENPLQLMPELCGIDSYVYSAVTDMIPAPTERGRGWVYFDPPSGGSPCQPYPTVSGLNGDGDPAFGTPEQTYMVQVYDGDPSISGSLVDPSRYMIDYVDGRIITPTKFTAPFVTYKWNYVSVVDEWAAVQASDPPVVVIDMHGTDKEGYQLGGGKKSVRKVDLHVFATDPAERNDIVETLYDSLFNRQCALYNFPTGSVLDYDGTFYGRREQGVTSYNKLTYLFDRERVSHVSSLFFDGVVARHVNLPIVMTSGKDEIVLSDLNAYRSKVSFTMFTYDDRNNLRNYS